MEIFIKILAIVNLVLMVGGVTIALHQLYTDVEYEEEEDN